MKSPFIESSCWTTSCRGSHCKSPEVQSYCCLLFLLRHLVWGWKLISQLQKPIIPLSLVKRLLNGYYTGPALAEYKKVFPFAYQQHPGEWEWAGYKFESLHRDA